MWIIGKANNDECNRMSNMGFEVKPVDEFLFNKALDPFYNPANDPELLEADPDSDQTVAVYVDCDVLEECRLIHEADNSLLAYFDPSEQTMLLQLALDALDEQSILDRNDISDETAREVWKKLDRLMNPEKIS